MLSLSTPASAANRICTRLSRRAAILPPLDRTLSCSRSPWSRSTRYFTFIAAPDLDRSRDEPEQNRRPPRFFRQAGAVSRLPPFLHGRAGPATCRSRPATSLPRDAALRSSDAPSARATRLHRAHTRSSEIHKDPRRSRYPADPPRRPGSNRQIHCAEPLAGLIRSSDRVFPVTANAVRLAWQRLRKRAG